MILVKFALSSGLRTSNKVVAFRSYLSTTVVCNALARDQPETDYWKRALRRMNQQEEKEQQVREQNEAQRKPSRQAYKKGPRLRGDRRDEEDVRISKTLSWLLRHGAKSTGVTIRADGYVKVKDVLSTPKFQDVNFQTLERIVKQDAKERYHLLFEPVSTDNGAPEDCWWIRANQGHSMKHVELEFAEIKDAGQIPMAVHGTNLEAWAKIEKEGLSPMKRSHIHLAQHVSHIKGARAAPGLRANSQILIYVDLDNALRAGIRFYLSANGVVLTKGDDSGFLLPKFFQSVTDGQGKALPGYTNVRDTAITDDIPSPRSREQREFMSSPMQVVEEASNEEVSELVIDSAVQKLSSITLEEVS